MFPEKNGRIGVRNNADLGFLVLLLGVAIFKLWLVGAEEILSQPGDQSEYASLSLSFYSELGECTSGRRPGLPAFIALFRLIGVPYRLGLEITYLAASAFLAWRLSLLARSRLIGAAIFALLAFHPWTLSGFRSLMAEPVACVFLFFTVGQILILLERDRIRLSDPVIWTLGFTLVALDLQRKETNIVITTYLLWMVILALRQGRIEWRKGAMECLVMALPLGLLLASHGVVKATNQRNCDVYTMSRMESPGFKRLIGALYRIEAEDAFLYAPVTRRSLTRAIAESPTLQQYEETLLDPTNEQTLAGQKISKRPGEFGPWLNNLLLNSFKADPATKDEQMSLAADELDRALASGRLPAQADRYPLDPNFKIWIPNLPASAARLLRHLLRPPRWRPGFDSRPAIGHNGPAFDSLLFDHATNRRASLTAGAQVSIYGQACSPIPVDLVGIEASDGQIEVLARPMEIQEPEIFKQLLARFDPSVDHCMSVSLQTRLLGTPDASLSFYSQGLKLGEVDLGNVQPMKRLKIDVSKSGPIRWVARQVHQVNPDNDQTLGNQLKKNLSRSYAGWALAISLIVLIPAGPRKAVGRRMVLVVSVLASAFLVRFAAITLLSATLGWNDARFILMIAPLFQILLLLVGLVLAGLLTRRLSASRVAAEEAGQGRA